MLEQYKQIYKKVADRIDNWTTMSKNDLVNKYIENEEVNPDLANSYMGAIICRYWGAVNTYYRKNYRQATPDDCHEWLIHAIMYAIKNRPWLDKYKKRLDKSGNLQLNKAYNDPNGPDKVINQCIKQTPQIFYDSIVKDNKRANYTTYKKVKKDGVEVFEVLSESRSLDNLIEQCGDHAIPVSVDHHDSMFFTWANQIIADNFRQQKYFQSFMLDMIANDDVFDHTPTLEVIFNKKRLASKLRSIDDRYCSVFAERFHINKQVVSEAAKNCITSNSNKMYKNIDKAFIDIRQQIKFYDDVQLKEQSC